MTKFSLSPKNLSPKIIFVVVTYPDIFFPFPSLILPHFFFYLFFLILSSKCRMEWGYLHYKKFDFLNQIFLGRQKSGPKKYTFRTDFKIHLKKHKSFAFWDGNYNRPKKKRFTTVLNLFDTELHVKKKRLIIWGKIFSSQKDLI